MRCALSEVKIPFALQAKLVAPIKAMNFKITIILNQELPSVKNIFTIFKFKYFCFKLYNNVCKKSIDYRFILRSNKFSIQFWRGIEKSQCV